MTALPAEDGRLPRTVSAFLCAEKEAGLQGPSLFQWLPMSRRMTAVGFEPTPLRNGALSHRLRPLGHTVSAQALYSWGWFFMSLFDNRKGPNQTLRNARRDDLAVFSTLEQALFFLKEKSPKSSRPNFLNPQLFPTICTIRSCRDPGSSRGSSDLQSDALPTELSRLCRSATWAHK